MMSIDIFFLGSFIPPNVMRDRVDRKKNERSSGEDHLHIELHDSNGKDQQQQKAYAGYANVGQA